MRDTTVAGLIAKLQEIVEINPEAAEYDVSLECMSCSASATPWKGTVFLWTDRRELSLEAPA